MTYQDPPQPPEWRPPSPGFAPQPPAPVPPRPAPAPPTQSWNYRPPPRAAYEYTPPPSEPPPDEPEPAYQPRPKPRKHRPAIQVAAFWIVAAAVVLAVAGGIFAALDGGKKSASSSASSAAAAIDSGASTAPSAARTIAVGGTLVLGESQSSPASWTSETNTVGEVCVAIGQWNNIASGTQITVKDATGAIIGETQLLAGHVAGAPSTGTVHPGQTCDFTFALAAVPAGKNLYTFVVGTRGDVTIPESELATVALSID